MNPQNQGIIHQLSEEVINKIAAGEIVQRPYSVVKELVENSLDALSKQINIYINGAGLDLIKICDNGIGIHKDDFPLLCERFATSKIQSEQDLNNLNSFGFRGEALASISFVSDLTIISKQNNNEIGHQAKFRDGKILQINQSSGIETIGCNDGTTILVENLFGNLSHRRSSISKLDEKKQILRLIQNLSIHHRNINFGLYVDKNCEFINSANITKIEQIMASIIKVKDDNFLQCQFEDQQLNFNCQMTYSKVSAIKGRKDLILFINNRLVECESIKRAIDQGYQSFYQSIYDSQGGFLVYCSLKLKQNHVDHNVHPNKKEVRFINEVEISNEIQNFLKNLVKDESYQKKYKLKQSQIQCEASQTSQTQKSIQQRQLIRVDPRMQTLDGFVQKLRTFQTQQSQKIEQEFMVQQRSQENQDEIQIEYKQQKLQAILKSKHHVPSYEQIRNMVYIGSYSNTYILIQVKTQLYIMNALPLLFCFYLNQLMDSINQMQIETFQVQIDQNDLEFKNDQMIRSLFHIEHACGEQSTISLPKFMDEQVVGGDELIAILNSIKSLDLNDDDDEGIFRIFKTLAEFYAFSFVNTNKQNSNSQQFDRDVYDQKFRDQIFPYLKQKSIIVNIQFEQYSKILLMLESIYSIFERC